MNNVVRRMNEGGRQVTGLVLQKSKVRNSSGDISLQGHGFEGLR